ncbi:nucleotidyl transferase AbiEii/AbiGii toxin family protein [Luteimicrobium subarcticum]|uniref:Nucleotidyltransferase AbiEii toxin of type IV toxin-antitoxin system n=1 Tax=Luteimicrobium subarcticum TaxID=620910 RepID=A0A2M8WQV4_9MICO|nr:nucleotidyl transferase AbiEii/AbiGii toxin family protein [Luteimicrobium subarcticum]PJI93315.1 nucleotidyltransferase AbiEii toxin of type IV toxin-antitoxin system [Luteimicrobium subarcticum]
MSPNPTRDTPAGRAYNDLRNLAKAQGRDPAEYLALYALEGFLTRLAASGLRDDFVLKGGVLLAAFAARRPTRDIDLAASGFPNDVEDVERQIRQIIATDVVDGLAFDAGAVRSESIREEADYAGVRVHLLATLSKARVPIHLDVNFGDPIWPAPQATRLPLLLGGEVELNGYPPHMVLAEKIVTAIDRGAANTRWRDFVDVAAITRTQTIDERELAAAIRVVASHREVDLHGLGETLAGMGEIAQARWSAWRRKQRLTTSTPDSFQSLLDEVEDFADPVLTDAASGLIWHPTARTWARGGGSSGDPADG